MRHLVDAGCRPLDADEGAGPTATADFVLGFAACPPSRPVGVDAPSPGAVSAARFGCWSFEIDAAGPWAWGAVAERRPSVHVRLVAHASAERIVLQEGALPVSPLWSVTRAQLQRTLARWPARAVADIASGAWARLPRTTTSPPASSAAPLAARAFWLVAQPWRLLVHAWRKIWRYDTWNVGVVALDQPLRDVAEFAALPAVRWWPARHPFRSMADPFPYRHAGRDWLLVEDFGPARGAYGRISRVDLQGGDVATVEPVIDRGRHLSYPCTFTDRDGRLYCAPEASRERDGCPIYRLDDDAVWREWRRILPGQQVIDPTIVWMDSRWWLFCTNGDAGGSLTLEAYHAEHLAGPWTPHALNPLKADLASARPAGRPFTIGGRVFRPAQDCSRVYGGAVVVMEILELTPERFREVAVTRIDPDPDGPYPDGLHHLVIDQHRIYLDGKKTRRDVWLWWKIWRHRQSAR